MECTVHGLQIKEAAALGRPQAPLGHTLGLLRRSEKSQALCSPCVSSLPSQGGRLCSLRRALAALSWDTTCSVFLCLCLFCFVFNFIEVQLIYMTCSVLIIFFFLAALGLRCCVWAFSSCGERGLLFVAVHGLIAVASLVAEHGL